MLGSSSDTTPLGAFAASLATRVEYADAPLAEVVPYLTKQGITTGLDLALAAPNGEIPESDVEEILPLEVRCRLAVALQLLCAECKLGEEGCARLWLRDATSSAQPDSAKASGSRESNPM